MPEFNFENVENILTGYLGGNYPVTKSEEFHLGQDTGEHLRKVVLSVKGKKAVGKDFVDIEAVAKLLPGPESGKDISTAKLAIRKEINFYKTVLPKLQDFQRKNKFVEVFSACPEFVGGRLNVDGGQEVDEGAAILLQNLWQSGKKT